MKNYIKPQMSIETIISLDIITSSFDSTNSFNITDVSGGDEITYDELLNNGSGLSR